jgi:threonine/homoserine/homoserine lactone efflux protein
VIAEWLPNLAVGWGVQWLGVLSPGPGVALILATATTQGRAPAVVTCLGIAMGAAILAFAAVMGLATILAEIAWAMLAVKIAGVIFLAWLAWKSFGRAMAPPGLPDATQMRNGRPVVTGLAMQLTNPKAILYWIAAAAVAGLDSAPWQVLALFVAGGAVNSFTGHGAWALALSSNLFREAYAGGRRWIEAALGTFFAFAAFKLATSET